MGLLKMTGTINSFLWTQRERSDVRRDGRHGISHGRLTLSSYGQDGNMKLTFLKQHQHNDHCNTSNICRSIRANKLSKSSFLKLFIVQICRTLQQLKCQVVNWSLYLKLAVCDSFCSYTCRRQSQARIFKPRIVCMSVGFSA